MGKKSFILYLKEKSPENSGKPSSYAKAMEVIENIFFTKNLTAQTDIWEFVSIENIDTIYHVVKREQQKEDGIFQNYKPESYWKNGYCSAALKEYKNYLQQNNNQTTPVTRPPSSLHSLPKPFILLAGISGTGKTRFVTEQAKLSAVQHGLKEGDNYCLVPVRPDWHEPSDLLGYISRINGTSYIATPFLKFIVKAMVAAVDSVNGGTIQWKPLADVPPFWLCLDEMNLAPVEQYFADYLSILETREWKNGDYSSEALLPSDTLKHLACSGIDTSSEPLDVLWQVLFKDVPCDFKDDLCKYYKSNGIPLPPNLIVAGTVNMDETTHGFSRKVIDRALTIDFQEFFPNDYDVFFAGQSDPKLFTFPSLSSVTKDDLPPVDLDGDKSKSVEFLKEINIILKSTLFELAYRALNELLLSVVCFTPDNDEELQAVWDDFLMQKVLPRIEGDGQKLKFVSDVQTETLKSVYLSSNEKLYGKGSVLHQLFALLETDLLKDIWGDDNDSEKRPDLLRDTDVPIECRSKKKLLWMMKRLKANHFTDFWV